MPVEGFSHVNLLVTDLDRARRFYAELLGLAELSRPGLSSDGLWFRVGDRQLHLTRVSATPPKPTEGVAHVALHVAAASLEPLVETLRAAGATILRPPEARVDFGETVRTAFCADPDGNVLELTDVGPLA